MEITLEHNYKKNRLISSQITLPNLVFILILLLTSSLVLISEILWFNQNLVGKLWEFYHHKGTLKTIVYILSFISSVAFLATVLFIKKPTLFLTLFIILIFPYFVSSSYTLINGYGFSSHELQVFLNNSNKFSNDVWSSYSSYIINSMILFFCILFFGLFIKKIINKNGFFIKSRYVITLGLLSFLMTFSVVYKTANTIFKYPTYSNFYNTIAYHLLNNTYYGERENLSDYPDSESLQDNIIIIIDESISYKYLSINGYKKETTPYLKSISNKYINLGRSSSIGNCSAMTNIGLMSGIQINQLPDKNNYSLKSPSIFQYAKNAGYTTHYISGQSRNELLQNYMTSFDLKSIDNFYQPSNDFRDDKIPEGDIINEIKDAVEKNEKNFIFVVKRGAHFHWSGQTPKNKIFFKPILHENDALTIENKEKAVNSYSNIVKYRVDDFFKELFRKTQLLDDKETFIIYTSDHGQSILEGESKGTHCDSTNPNLNQGIVPLLVFSTKNKKPISHLPKDSFSHFEIFPTALKIMGYESYSNGYTFFNKIGSNQFFSSGDIFGRASFHLNDISKLKKDSE